MSSLSLLPRTRVYLFWRKDRSTGCRQVLFSGKGATTQLVWDAGRNHFSTTEVLATGWHSGMLLGDDFDVAAVEPFLVPPSTSCLDIEITTSQPGPLSPPIPPIKIKQPPPLLMKRSLSPSTHISSSLPIISPLAENSWKASSPSEYGMLEECYTVSNGDLPAFKSTSRNFSESDNYFDHLIAENETRPNSQGGSDSIYDVPRNCQPVEATLYQVPPNNQLVHDSIYKVPTNNNDIYQYPSNIPVTEVCEEKSDLPRKQSSDLGNAGMLQEIKAPDCENGASSDGEDFYQVPLTNIARPKLCNGSNEVRIPSHYDTHDRPLLMSKAREVSRVLSPLGTSESGATSPNEVTPSSPVQDINSAAQRAHLLKRGPIPHNRTHSKPASPPPDTPDTARAQRNVESELQLLRQELERERRRGQEVEREVEGERRRGQDVERELEGERRRGQEVERELEGERRRGQEVERELEGELRRGQEVERELEQERRRRQDVERELLRCKTEGELWRSDSEETAQKLTRALSQLETERSAVRRLSEEVSELRADCHPISCSPLSETSRPAASRGRAPQITKPKPVIPKPAKRAVK